ncbi:MAG: twin-arginine translocation signal domain-containing protein [Paludisphaera borealis]|uniref:twin-arginine translocation signal domain-containing protein n=1 Tax=Paludisphaera borealis TaxID=1387353 RepID=UPI002848E958|nr:twin-arginine translocation signal domain-containing protein [Paludisphaera borealis]MDR3620587.1 twin-arginine translocation signal domain-containing protein [Paludisphaera borealis]
MSFDVRLNLDQELHLEHARLSTRRQFLKRSQTGLGAIALAALMGRDGRAGDAVGAAAAAAPHPHPPKPPHHPANPNPRKYLNM